MFGTDDGRHGTLYRVVHVEPWDEWCLGEGLEVTVDAFAGPGVELRDDVFADRGWLQAEGVATEVY